MAFADWIGVAPRFSRSVNLERDALIDTALDGYILTATGQDVLDRICSSLAQGLGHRAWTITGAYGSGKSAFTLFVAELFGLGGLHSDKAKDVVRQQAPQLFSNYFDRRKKQCLLNAGYCPILVSGTSEPILEGILRASVAGLESHFPGTAAGSGARKLRKLLTEFGKGQRIQPNQLVQALTETSLHLRESGQSQGLLVAIDELGKFLEFAAREPEGGDIFVLQQLAEATEGASGLILITVLHQSFERYAAALPISARQEWSKIQGRFEDVSFQESPEQMLALISRGIYQSASDETESLQKAALQQAKRAVNLGLCPKGLSENEFCGALVRCAPLHPLTVLVLVRLCRKFGQNQRSLFAFLTSREPDSFSSFVADLGDVDFYRLPKLYDYLSQTLGTGLSIGENATRWAEIESALLRRNVGRIEEINTIKAIGLFSAIGVQGGLKANREILAFALGVSNREMEKILEGLTRSSVVVFRKHVESYALWQGSDVDLEAKAKEARKRLQGDSLLASKLNTRWRQRPLVARRHSYETGTLRYFAVRFTEASSFSTDLEIPADTDGLIVYCVPNGEGDHEQLLKLGTSSALIEKPSVLVALPNNVDLLREAMDELDVLEWIEQNTPELSGDPTARRELLGRKLVAQNKVELEVTKLFEPTSSLTTRKTRWFNAGMERTLTSSRTLSTLLSAVCDRVYPATPRLRNELLNRRSLSSAAAAARRNLIEAIIAKSTEPDLGFTGTPPEMSMYQSVFRATGVHAIRNGILGFGAPPSNPELHEVWTRIESFFDECELRRKEVSDLFLTLQRPPYGLKMGLIPVLFVAAVVAHDTEVALYENDAFIPEVTVETFERLLRAPEKFKVRKYGITGVRKDVFDQFSKLLVTGEIRSQHLISVVRPLYRFITRLPAYSRQTRSLSPHAISIRETLFSSREPDALLFDELPRACGFQPFENGPAAGREVSEFFASLKTALNELQHAYDDLLLRIQKLLYTSFNLTQSDAIREILRYRAQRLQQSAVEPRLKAFLHHLAEDKLEDVLWIEAIGSLLVGKPPKVWNDADCAKYEANLTDLARSFRHLEVLAIERSRQLEAGTIPAEIMRISVADVRSREREAVVVVQAAQTDILAGTMIRVEEVLGQAGLDADPNLALAVLAAVSRRFLEDFEGQTKSHDQVDPKRKQTV